MKKIALVTLHSSAALAMIISVWLLSESGCYQVVQEAAQGDFETYSERFRNEALEEMQEHAEILMKQGRIPSDYGSPEMILGTYGWHYEVDRGNYAESSGSQPDANILRVTRGGSFGAYTFSPEAFEQAGRSWWIHGMMKEGSDILKAVNRNASFETKCTYWGSVDSAGNQDSGKDCMEEMGSPIGFNVGYIYGGPEGAKVVEVISSRELRLDKKAEKDVLQYDLGILPPDYVDYCACTMPAGDWRVEDGE